MSLLEKASLIVTPNAVKAGKLYSVVPNTTLGDMDVVRDTTATRTNSLGLIETVGLNVPRLNYTNGSCPSLLVEPQRTNLILYSEEFNNASWFKLQSSITANSINSPSGDLTADTFIADGTSNTHLIASNIISFISGTTYTVSVFAKKNTNNFIQFVAPILVGGMFANFDLNNGVVGTVGTSSGSNPTSSIQNYGNGWYRCNMIFVSTATISSGSSICLVTSASSGRAQSNSLSTSVYLWGAQLELGSNATSYIPTVASTVTRNADVISKTGISSLIGQTEGTLFADLKFTNVGTEKYILNLKDIAGSNAISFRRLTSGEIRFVLTATTSSGTTNQSTAVLPNGNYKIAYKYVSGSLKIFINGALLFTLTPTFTFGTALSIIEIGNQNSGSQLNDSINLLSIFKTALTDTECIQLTTL